MVAFRSIPGVRRIAARHDRIVQSQVDAEVAPLREEIDALRAHVEQLRLKVEALGWDLDSVTPHLAALEERFADRAFEEKLERADLSDADRTVVEMMTTEHTRISARLQAVSHYEERLRRLEAGQGS